VTVVLGEKLKGDKGCPVSGHYENRRRVITIDRNEPPYYQWFVYYHELAHVAMYDAGLDSAFSERMTETLCDIIATARMRERFG